MADYYKSFSAYTPAFGTITESLSENIAKEFNASTPAFGTISETLSENICKEFNASTPAFGTIVETLSENICKEFSENTPAFGTIAETVQKPTFADPVLVFLHDADVGYSDYTTEAREDTADDVPLLPDPVGSNDSLYVGLGNNLPYAIMVNVTTAGVGTYGITVQYWNGSWSSLDAVGEIPNDDYKVAEDSKSAWLFPSDYVKNVVNGFNAYWVRLRYSTGTLTTQPLAGRIKIAHTPLEAAAPLWTAHF